MHGHPGGGGGGGRHTMKWNRFNATALAKCSFCACLLPSFCNNSPDSPPQRDLRPPTPCAGHSPQGDDAA